MRKFKFGLMTFAIAAASVTSSPRAQADDFSQVRASKGSLSKLIRSNTRHFWNTMRGPDYQTAMKKFLPFTGVVTGDPHFGNFSVIPLVDLKGNETLEWANIDFDDAGIAPYALDFVRLVVAAKAIEFDQQKSDDKFANIPEMIQAYVDGLNGKKQPAPALIRQTLDEGIDGYRKELSDLVDKKTNKNNEIKLVDGEVVAPSKKLDALIADTTALFKREGMEVLDIARVLKDRGGSASALRLLVLVRDSDKELRLFDVKQWQETSLTSYQKQKPVMAWLADLHPVFWPGKSPSTYTLEKLDGSMFWIREKKKSVLDVPYDIKKETDLTYLQNLAPFVANTLGLIHGRQASAKPLAKLLLNANSLEEFRQAVKTTYRAYMNEAIKSL